MKSFGLILCLTLCLILSGQTSSFADSPVTRIKVEKAARLMTLYDANDQVVRSYKISLGNTPIGNKTQSGDGKTPEGAYIIDRRNPQSAYHLSLHISYPNTNDLMNSKEKESPSGGGIFIHGQPNGRETMQKYRAGQDWTLGCISVSNKEIEEIWTLVADGTPIVITP